ncbi:hypothetical protein HYPSUDRAFT_198532 [Hypholoma sublateritium FD-334 SS-4]|uniref:Uncharacterized protein n=1 Tax=Hypholoma sublateritium (strain FD-334 SS-4) TaxID=945553 RepID=A0A0D2PDW4_HYPSF|nr:hypothetical protein HYPSUDRAFT_198532 [Hypholoma sublateritium FD-334 SS-4]
MNPFVAYLQYLALVEENTAARHSIHSPASNAHGVPPGDAYELDGSASSPCSPLVMSSPSLPRELLDFSTQDSLQPEAPAFSILFQPSGSALANMSPGLEHYQLTSAHFKHQPPSDACTPSFEATVYTLADEALNLTPAVKDDSFAQRLLKEHAPVEVLEQAFSLLTDAREAVTLRRSIVLTEIGFQLEEIRTKLRVYDSDVETLAAISQKINETEALAQNECIILDFTSRHRTHPHSSQDGQLSFSQRHGPFLSHIQPILDQTKHLRQEACVCAVFRPKYYVYSRCLCRHDRVGIASENCTFAFETIPAQPDEETYRFMKEYPTSPHPNARHPLPICRVFNEGGRPTRNLYEFHKHWRHVLDTMTVMIAYQEVTIYRPIFETAFSNFYSGDFHDKATIKEVWSFISLLLDIVLESVSAKFLSGESSTKSASQHAEQVLVGIGHSVKPFLDLYMSIYRTAVFSHLTGRLNVLNIPICTFSTMSEIVNDVGGRYIYYLVRDFITQAKDAIVSQVERDALRVFAHHDICTLRFPDALDYHMLPSSELYNIAFNPLINNLFLAGTVEKTLGSLDLADYVIVAPARNNLYCCTGVRKLTHSLFDAITCDVVIHGYYKRHNHMFLAAEIFAFASTIIMFHIHSIRTGCLAGRTHPIVDPAFRVRGADGEFTQTFLTVWGVHADALRGFGMMNSSGLLPGIDFPFSTIPAAGSLNPEGLHTPSPIIRRQRSMVNMVSGYFTSRGPDDTPPRVGPASSASGSPGGLSPLPFSAPTRSPTTSSPAAPHSPFRSVKSALQEFIRASELRVDSTFRDGSSRFPLLHAMAMRREQKLSEMAAPAAATTSGAT